MASKKTEVEFLQEKWRDWFKALDVNKDGALTRQDYTDCLGEIENYYRSRVDEKTLEDMREGYRMFWEDLLFRRIIHKDSIDIDEFVISITEEYQKDPGGFRQLVRGIFEQATKCVDADHNDFVSYDEFVIVFSAFGHKDVAVVKQMFEDYGPTEKGVPLQEFMESWIDVVVGIDQEKPNIPVNGFMSTLQGASKKTDLEFLQGKWRDWFKTLDVNKDGALSRQDYIDSLGEFENYYRSRVDEKTLEGMREGFRMFWEDLVFKRILHKDSINIDEFVTSLTEEYQKDPEELRQFIQEIFHKTTKCIDADHNGFVSYDEFTTIFSAFGHRDADVLKQMFEDYRPTEKGVSLEDFIQSWIDLVVGTDQEKLNIPVNGFMSTLENA